MEEAALCLLPFVKEVANAIKALHDSGYAHQDLRLDNVCFSKVYKAVLIDLDWMCRLHDTPDIGDKNPMFNVEQNDWLQLGLIISWVTGDHKLLPHYYAPKRQQAGLDRYAGDSFFCSLMNGKYVEEDLAASMLSTCNKSLESVLKERHVV